MGNGRLPVCGDGNYFFSAVAAGMIISQSQTDFHEVGIQVMDTAETIGHQLGQIAVRKWKDHYTGFLADTHIEE